MDDYLAQCDEFGGGLNNLQTWQELRSLLSRRNGWRFEVANTPHPTAAWCFGLAGACRFIVTLVQGQVCLYVMKRTPNTSSRPLKISSRG